MEDIRSQKERLKELVQKLGGLTDSNTAKKYDVKYLERVCRRLVEFYDDCQVCREYGEKLLRHQEETQGFTNLQNKQVLASYHATVRNVVAHLQKEHKLIAEGTYMSTYMCLGLAIGTALGSAFQNIAIGMSIGLCLGIALGSGIDADYKKKGQVI
ncbi:MAG: hypothetical protein N2376_04340 [Clostridia bacterium]|nr:hypothetical protein [Clostridia bacterium]